MTTARPAFTIQRASRDELADLAQWYRRVDPALISEPDADYDAARVDYFDDGVLGAALELPDETAIRRAFDQIAAAGPPHKTLVRHLFARTLVLSARRGSQTVGVLELAPPIEPYRQLINHLERTRAAPPVVIKVHMDMTVRLAKLHVVSVLPEARGRGAGRALVHEALAVARRSATQQVYGQFDTSPQLETFYAGLGFTVHTQGTVMKAVGGYQIESRPTEQLFSTIT